jgi:non-specific serine/threonine protein kinase
MAPGADDLEPIIGREAEVARLETLLSRARLVTITAPGGSGKTRLALELVRRARSEDRPATFVDLATVNDAAVVGSTVAAAVDGAAGLADPFAALAERVRAERHLFVLDNLEQIPGVAPSVLRLAETMPGARFLVTSRVPLEVSGEVEVALAPLEIPDDPSNVEVAPASALFLRRARDLGGGGTGAPDAATAAAIVELCRRLDGLPLALELAAARTRILSPEEILARLDSRGLRAIDPAEASDDRSMTAIVTWTVSLLSSEVRGLLDAATVCDGFDLELLEAISGADDAAGPVEQLVRLGLVRVSGRRGGRTRYGLLETIRGAVLAELPPERVAALRTAHAHAIADRAERAWAAVDQGSSEAVDQMEADIDNDRRAIDELTQGDPEGALRLWRRMQALWVNGRLREGIDRFGRLAERIPGDSVELARGLPNMAHLVAIADGPSAAAAIHRRHLEIARRSGDDVALASALSSLAMNALYAKDLREAERLVHEIEKLDLNADPDAALHAGEGRAIALLTIDGPTGRRALDAFRELVALARPLRRLEMVMNWMANIAFLHLCREEWAEAELAGAEALTLAGDLNRSVVPIFAASVAIARAHLGRLDEAASVLVESVDTRTMTASSMPVADVLRAGATIAALQGNVVLAARLAGAASKVWAEEADELDAGDILLAERTMTLVRRGAREIDVELALREGGATDPVVLLGSLEELLAAPPGPVAPTTGARLRHGELTRREIEILTLVGQGRSDPEIAQALFISPKTASVHVANIKGKLGVGSRLEIALRARELGLS